MATDSGSVSQQSPEVDSDGSGRVEIESQSDESERNAGSFLDLEASESGSESSNQSGHDIADGLFDIDAAENSFPHFMRLPPEIRRLIWQKFCPELAGQPRVLDFQIVREVDAFSASMHGATDGPFLQQLTAPSRVAMAVHRESRALGLRALPDELEMGSRRAVIRLNKHRDVVLVSASSVLECLEDHVDSDDPFGVPSLPGFSEIVVNLAIDGVGLNHRGYIVKGFEGLFHSRTPSVHVIPYVLSFPNLERVYCCLDDSDFGTSQLTWCASNLVNHYQVQVDEELEGLATSTEFIFSWPNFGDDSCHDYISHHLPIYALECGTGAFEGLPMLEEFLASVPMTDEDLTRVQSLEIWPMVRFAFDEGVWRWEHLAPSNKPSKAWGETGDSSGSDHESETDSDQYEDDGFVVPDDDAEDSRSNDEGSDSNEEDLALNGFSPVDLDGGADAAAEDTHSPVETGVPSARRSRLAKKRQILSSDAEDDDIETDNVAKQAGSKTIGRARVVLSDSDDEIEGDNTDEHQEDESDGDAVGGASDSSRDGTDALEQDAEESEGDAVGNNGRRKPLTLIERLAMYRVKHRVESSSPESADSSDGNGDPFDVEGYGDDADEDE